MDPWVLAPAFASSCAALGCLLAFGRFAVSWSVVAKGDPSGAWAFVSGLSALGVSVTFVAAEGVPAHFVCFVLGRRATSVTLTELRQWLAEHASKPAKPKKPSKRRKNPRGPRSAMKQLRGLYGTISAWVDPVDALASLANEHRRIRLDWLSVETRYGFRDPILTGQITAALYVIDGLLPARVSLVASPDWDAENRATLQIAGRATLFVGRFVSDLVALGCRAVAHRLRFAWQHRRLSALPADPLPTGSPPPPPELVAPR